MVNVKAELCGFPTAKRAGSVPLLVIVDPAASPG